MNEAYKLAYYHGFKPQDLYDLTIGEINEILKQKELAYKTELRKQASFIYIQAKLNSIGFNEPNKMPKTIEKAFPGLFEKPKGIPFPDFLRRRINNDNR